MKHIKLLVLALILCFGALSSLRAAITHDTTLYGSDIELIYVYASPEDFEPMYDFTSYGWEADILLYDDQDGTVRLTWFSAGGPIYIEYAVSADHFTWTLTSGSPVGFNAASMAALNYIFWPPL